MNIALGTILRTWGEWGTIWGEGEGEGCTPNAYYTHFIEKRFFLLLLPLLDMLTQGKFYQTSALK